VCWLAWPRPTCWSQVGCRAGRCDVLHAVLCCGLL
jgi:hypothetical protein